MSSYTDQATNAASGAAQSTAYGAERTKQELGSATATTNAYADQAKGYGQSALETAQNYAASAGTAINNAGQQVNNALNNLQTNASNTTNAAVSEGQRDVNSVKSADTATYVDQAKQLAGTALSTAQGYVAAAGQAVAPADPNATGVLPTIQSTAASALTTGAQYLGSAHATITGANTDQIAQDIDNAASSAAQTAQSTVSSAQNTAQPYVDSAKDATKPYVDSANQTANQAATTASNTYDSTKNSAANAYDSTKSSAAGTYGQATSNAQSATDDIAARAQDLKQNAAEGVDAYLKLAQDKANDVQQTHY